MTKEEFREWSKENQYYIPRKLEYIADCYPTLPWKKAKKMYEIAVKATLSIFSVDNIIEIPFGKGYSYARELWEEMITHYIKERESKCEHKIIWELE